MDTLFDTSDRCFGRGTATLINKQNLIQFLDRLGDIEIVDDCLLEDIRKIDALGIFPERTKRLLGEKEIVYIYNVDKPLDDIVTFVIPVCIDSSERRKTWMSF